MRMTKEELLKKTPSWNTKYDIVKIMYGDIPHHIYGKLQHESFLSLTGTLSNIMAVDNYIYTQNGEYEDYRTLIGDIKIKTNGDILCGDIRVTYYGKVYNIYLNNMYGKQGLDILRLGSNVTGWCNKDGNGSPSCFVKELDGDIVGKVLGVTLEDYGESVQMFVEKCREVYVKDKENYILNKRFGAK